MICLPVKRRDVNASSTMPNSISGGDASLFAPSLKRSLKEFATVSASIDESLSPVSCV
jgi:hypothetical protein